MPSTFVGGFPTKTWTTGVKDFDGQLVLSPNGAGVVQTDTKYDWYGRVIWQRGPAHADDITTFSYDGLGRETLRQHPDGTRKTTAYNDTANTITITDENGHSKRFEYTPLGKIGRVFDADTSALLLSYEYDNLLRTTKEVVYGPQGVRSNQLMTYDRFNRVLSVQKTGANNAVLYQETYEYDDANSSSMVKVIKRVIGDNAAPTTVSVSYAVETVMLQEDGTENRTRYEYDGLGNKTATVTGIVGTDEEGAARNTQTYNQFANPLTITDALGQAETYTYDAVGRPLTKTDRNGNITKSIYDDLDRVLEAAVYSPDNTLINSTQFEYSANGQKILEKNENLTVAFKYDELGQLIRQEESSGAIKEYSYDLAGNRTKLSVYVDGKEEILTQYNYDGLNRMTEVLEKGSLVAFYTYDPNGNRVSLTYPNGTVVTYTYNQANLVRASKNKLGDTVLSSYEYTYYMDGNQASKTDHTGKVTRYTYDSMGRLVTEDEEGDICRTYAFDRFSNRASMTVTGPENYTTAYTYDLGNRLLREQKEAEGEKTEISLYHYDANGNQLSRQREYFAPVGTSAKKAISFSADIETLEQRRYNGVNQLTWVYIDGVQADYSYRPDGLRHKKVVDGHTATHIWDGQNIVAEINGNDQMMARYLRGIGLLAREQDDGRQYYLFNAHGDVVQRTDDWGNLLKAYEYDVFGVEKAPEKLDSNPFRYSGEYYDDETATYYLRARYYNPRIGRFSANDPIRNGLNWYTYCGNNPISFVDPRGLSEQASLNIKQSITSINAICSISTSQNEGYITQRNLHSGNMGRYIAGGEVTSRELQEALAWYASNGKHKEVGRFTQEFMQENSYRFESGYDYDQYDVQILGIVNYLNWRYELLLDPNHIKAIMMQESGLGKNPQNSRDLMAALVGVQGIADLSGEKVGSFNPSYGTWLPEFFPNHYAKEPNDQGSVPGFKLFKNLALNPAFYKNPQSTITPEMCIMGGTLIFVMREYSYEKYNGKDDPGYNAKVTNFYNNLESNIYRPAAYPG